MNKLTTAILLASSVLVLGACSTTEDEVEDTEIVDQVDEVEDNIVDEQVDVDVELDADDVTDEETVDLDVDEFESVDGLDEVVSNEDVEYEDEA